MVDEKKVELSKLPVGKKKCLRDAGTLKYTIEYPVFPCIRALICNIEDRFQLF